jgi:hypothetical protein
MANFFGRHILLLCVAYAGGDPPPNQLILHDYTEHTSNCIANTFSIRETPTAHGCKMHPSFEDFISKLFDLVRRHIFLLVLGGPCFAHGCCLSLSLTRPFQKRRTMQPPVAIFFTFNQYLNIGTAFCCPSRLQENLRLGSGVKMYEYSYKNWRAWQNVQVQS